jgi:hypothetical protein
LRCTIRQHIKAIIIIVLFFLVLSVSTGILFSGFHIKDGTKLLNWNKSIEQKGLINTIQALNQEMKTKRLLPVSWDLMCARVKVCKFNFFFYNLSTLFMLIICAFFLYLFARKIDLSFGESLFFAFFTLLGQQGICWWRFFTAEPFGMFFLAATLFLMAKNIGREKNRGWIDSLFCLSLVCTSLSKESFILMIPAILFWKVWLTSNKAGGSFRAAIKRGKWPILFMTLVMAVELLLIVFYVGTDHEPIVQLNAAHPIAQLFLDPVRALRNMEFSIFVLLEVATFFVMLFGIFLIMQTDQKKYKKDAACLITLFVLIFLPQMILYSYTGLRQRFWLPAFLAFSFAVTFLLNKIRNDQRISNFSRIVFIVMVLMVFLPRVGHTFFKTGLLAEEGYATEAFGRAISNGSQKDSIVILVADPVMDCEGTFTIPNYVSTLYGDRTFYHMMVETGRVFHNDDLTSLILRTQTEQFKDRDHGLIGDHDLVDCIAIFPNLEKQFLSESKTWFDKDGYTRDEVKYFEGNFVIFSKKQQK